MNVTRQHASVLLSLVLLAGCAGTPLGQFGSDASTFDGSTENITDAAMNAEEAYLTSVLENAPCLESWGTFATVTDPEATVENRTAGKAYVSIRHPYWYGTESESFDGASRAMYVVNADGAWRIHGDSVAPCE